MNDRLQEFARVTILEGLAQLPANSHRMFRLMYGRQDGKRSVEDALVLPIEDVLNEMSYDKLDRAMVQVEASLKLQASTK